MSDHPNLAAALAAFQAEIKNPPKNRKADTGKYNYMYADIGDVLETVLPVLSRHGLSITQPTKIVENTIVLVTRLCHVSGEFIESEYPVSSLNGNHQAMGAAMTYARRYALTSLIGVAAVDDTDGAGAAEVGEGPRVKMTASQARTEINWEEIQASIDGAPSFAALDKLAERVEARKGFWPESYYTQARERILTNRLQMAEEKLSAARTPDDLANVFAELEVILDHKVPWDSLAALHRKYEQKLADAFQLEIQ